MLLNSFCYGNRFFNSMEFSISNPQSSNFNSAEVILPSKNNDNLSKDVLSTTVNIPEPPVDPTENKQKDVKQNSQQLNNPIFTSRQFSDTQVTRNQQTVANEPSLQISSSSTVNIPDISNINCVRTCVRKEIHNMSPEEIQAFVNAYIRLAENGVLNTLVNWHVGVWTYAHFTSYFLPWHRGFALVMEQALQQVDPNVCLPYWDHSREAQNPWASIVWKHFGGDGYGGCIRDGPLKDIRVNGQCIRRNFQKTSFVHVKTVNSMVTGYTQFQQFSTNFEVYPHATPHARIGGSMDGPRSPLDILFWLHHGNS
eukprot:NODE_215_length_14308_cov_0.330987.p6 type:complete len:311 gc:universal NODE_215_length_14308_cov_0.330987:11914-10982(-)